jgi:hypothetical protein
LITLWSLVVAVKHQPVSQVVAVVQVVCVQLFKQQVAVAV